MIDGPVPRFVRSLGATREQSLADARAAMLPRPTAAPLAFAPGARVVDTVTGGEGVIIGGQQTHHVVSTPE